MIEVDGNSGFPPQALLPIGMITIGSIVVFISFLGCCGAIREDVCMTMCYAVLMLILLIVQLVVVVLLWTNKDKIVQAMDDVVDSAWQREAREAGVFEAVQKSVSRFNNSQFVMTNFAPASFDYIAILYINILIIMLYSSNVVVPIVSPIML